MAKCLWKSGMKANSDRAWQSGGTVSKTSHFWFGGLHLWRLLSPPIPTYPTYHQWAFCTASMSARTNTWTHTYKCNAVLIWIVWSCIKSVFDPVSHPYQDLSTTVRSQIIITKFKPVWCRLTVSLGHRWVNKKSPNEGFRTWLLTRL